MEDEIDIYADLPNFNVGDNENLAEKNKKISEKCMKLEKQVSDLTQSLESLQKINTTLEVNLSSLLQTAKAEIARKDRMIADIRRQLDNMQFRRDEYSRAVKPARRSPPRRKRENSPKETNHVIKVPELPDTTEFTCSIPPPSIDLDQANAPNKSHRLDGIVSTVFGERLRKRILEEQEEERKQKELSKASAEIDSKKMSQSIRPEEIAEGDAQSALKADSIKSDCKVNSVARLRNKGSSLGSSSSFNSQEDAGFLKWNHSDKKRQSEDVAEIKSSSKKFKSNDGKNRYRDSSRHSDRGTRSTFKNSLISKTDERPRAEILASDKQTDFHIVDECEAPVKNDLQNKNEGVNTADDNETQDRHNRVAIRLMLLAEGIDPDVETKKSVQAEQKKVVDDKRESHKKRDETSRSRSKSKNRRHNHRSRSRTPDEYRKGRRRSRQPEDRHRRSKDRFERRKESKNKDGDNLSEFSREICDLKERIEHRVDDKFSDRARKGTDRSLNRHKRNDEKICKSGRSRTPDSSRSGSKERTVHRPRADKRYRRSQSRERHKSGNRGKRNSNLEDISIQHSKTVVPERDRTENVEIIPSEDLPQVTENPETKSLLSLEDGEIVDSESSSPVKMVNPVQSLTDKTLPSDCQLNLLDSNEVASVIDDPKYPLPLREIGNSQKTEKSLLAEKPAVSVSESSRSTGKIDSLNSSKDERIENIAEFIANFASDISESKKDEKLDAKIIHNDVRDEIEYNTVALGGEPPQEKIRYIINSVFQGSSKDSPLVSPLKENSNAVSTKNVNSNNGDDDWCLIAIDSPIKNFEENRKNRMIAQNLKSTEMVEPSKTVSTEDLSLKHSNNSTETLGVDKSHRKIDSEVKKIVSDKTVKPLVQTMKNTSKTKPTVLTSLRSTYYKGRKEMILSDTNSEHCTKISMLHPVNSDTKRLSNESGTVQQSRDDINKPVEAKSNGKLRSKSPVLEDVSRNGNSSQKGNEKKSADDLLGQENDSVNTAKDKGTTADDHSDITGTKKIDPATIVKCVDETSQKIGKSKANNSKTDKETVTKIGSNPKPELRNSIVKESKSKESTSSKTDLSNTCKTDVTKSIGSKNKTGNKVEKNDENEDLNIRKSLENGIKSTKVVSKAKAEGSNSKQKKEPQKLIVSRRRKPVHLEDSSTSSSIVRKPNSIIDTANISEQSTNNVAEPSNSLDVNSPVNYNRNSETSIEQSENQEPRTIAKSDSAYDDQSEFSNVKEKRIV